MNQDLDTLIKYIVKNFVFTKEQYPKLDTSSEKAVFDFSLRHAGIHFAKTTGKIMTEIEKDDHGKEMSIENLKVDTAKQLINTLIFAHILNISGDELVERIRKNYEK